MNAYPAIAAPERRAMAGAAFAALALSLAAAAPVAAAGGDPAYRQLLTREGIEVELTIDPLAAPGTPLTEDASVRVRFRVTDGHTGQPLSSLYPAGWLDLLEAGAETSAEDCRTRVGSFIGGGFLARAELDLNVYYVLALNQDPSISVVDPLFGFGGSKLLTTVELPGPGGDWALSADGERLFVTLPDHDRVAVVETASWRVVTTVPTGPGPVRIAAQPDGAYLWVGWSEGAGETARGGVTVVSATAMKPVAEFTTGAGPHDLAFSDDGRYAYVTNRGAGTVSVIDVAGLTVASTVATGPSPVAVAYSPLAGAAFVSDETAGTVTVIEGAGPEPAARIAVAPGLGRLRFAPDGRLGFVPVPSGDAVYILDAATRRVVHNAQVEQGPVEVGFSDELAYVSHQGSDTVLMIPLAAIGREGEPVPVIDFPGGNNPPGKTPAPTPAAGIVQAPGAPAVLVANPLDRSIYYYKEGMAAPMGHFSNYGRVPRAVMVVDRSLREFEPGVYETAVRLRRPGPYDLAFFLDSPRIIHCFQLEIAADPELAAKRVARRAVARPLGGPRPAAVGEAVELTFRVADPETDEPIVGLGDVRVLTMATASNWHRRQPAEEAEPGVYRVRFVPETAGLYYAFVEVPSLGIDSNQSPYLALRARAADERVGGGTETGSESEPETVAAAGEGGGEP
jgi:YVTN family beta-propeller protein